ncbi:LuxR C-terminal-related transcriptional regulator [Archangium violaceum]|uniref:helix-turn-helix transcriptional regulator n=1 Tax=Archangium violaceum TaxID=83451 RepID=UPI002B2F5FD3|nr:LuxR C-terminal-related transcriptional regulator [Archangium gephyra]
MLRDRAITALNSSLSLPQALEAVRPHLLELAQADSMALCIMEITHSLHFQWLVPGHRIPILEEYASLVDHDFFRAPIFARPQTVIRDSEILSRREYERSLICQRSRELEPRIEHIMAVLLPIRPGFFAALALYRNRPRAYSSQNAAVLASLTAHWMNTVRNCSDVQDVTIGTRLIEELYRRTDAAILIVEPPHREVLRSSHATVLLERWFTPSDLHSSGLPLPLKERLDALVRMDPDARLDKNVWVSLHADGYRTVRFIELPNPEGPRRWALLMHEIPISIPLPAEMKRKLTPREVTIATCLLRNWTNKQIADELKRSLHTVKTHVRNLLDKLGVDGRADLLYQAARLNKPV